MNIELVDIHKRFGPVHANNAISVKFNEGRIVGVLGENGAGKTQLCYVAAIEAIELFKGNVVWIDCEDTFRPERIVDIAMARGYIFDEISSPSRLSTNYFPG